MNGKKEAVSPEELIDTQNAADAAEVVPFEEIYSGTAVFANKMYVTLVPPVGVRITFMEAPSEGQERFRSAVYLSIPDAMSLRDVISKQLEKVEVTILTAADASAEVAGKA